MSKLLNVCNETYAEEHQDNPLQWKICHPTKEGDYKDVSGWIICKDFFNDYAYSYNTGKGFTIYSYNGLKMQPTGKPQDFFCAMRNTTPEFEWNISCMNHWLGKQDLPLVGFKPDVKGCDVVLRIPAYYLKNTHHISLLTLIIRLMNVKHKFNTFQEVIDYKNFEGGDNWKWEAVVKKDMWFNIPDKLKNYIFYAGPEHHSEANIGYGLSSVVHNNGVLSWQEQF